MLTPELTRSQTAAALSCTHAELGRLLREKRAPLPVRVAGVALWFRDEVERFAKAHPRAVSRKTPR